MLRLDKAHEIDSVIEKLSSALVQFECNLLAFQSTVVRVLYDFFCFFECRFLALHIVEVDEAIRDVDGDAIFCEEVVDFFLGSTVFPRVVLVTWGQR